MKCHICNKDVESFQDEKRGITFYHCKACEYLFKDPECYQDFDAQEARYNLHENDENDAGYQAYFQRFINFILPNIKTAKSALDFGCGRSTLLAILLEKEGLVCDAYDPIYHPNTLDDSKKYDLIVSTEVFEHLHQPSVVFEALLSRLKKGGYLALQTEFHPNEKDKILKWWYPNDPTHIVFFRRKTFEVLCVQNGCELIAQNSKNMVLIKKC